MYWERDKECMDREELEHLQFERLQSTLNRVYGHVPFYRRRFDEAGVSPESVESLSDIVRLPFTTKEDILGNYPYGLFAVPLREIVRIHSSSSAMGTSVVGYTRNDLKTWSMLTARVLTAGGVTKDDVIQVSMGYGLFTGGFGMHQGAERIGASVIPASSGNTARQIQIMKDFKTTALVSTPSYAMRVADAIREMGVSVSALSLKYGLFGAEPWSERMRQRIQEALGIIATDNYGLSAVLGPGVAGECLERKGLHIQEDHFFVEVIDPDTLAPVPPGTQGELVITTLTKEGIPMIRYRTRDLARILPGQCPCSRTSLRMSRVVGRTDDMLIIRGVNVFPSQIEAILFEAEGERPAYQIVVERKGALDEVCLRVGVDAAVWAGLERRKTAVQSDTLRKRLAHDLGISIEVEFTGSDSLEQVGESVPRVLDRRTL